jgi:hypothetical protein
VYPPLPPQVEFLDRVIARVRTPGEGGPPVVVFDLDGTLYDNRARTQRILADYADGIRGALPEIADSLSSLDRESVAYMLADTLHGCGIHRVDAVQAITAHWRERFFSEAALAYDETVHAAAAYVRACHQAGATVVYFTGRDVSRLLGATVHGLRDRGFPIGVAGVELLFNPDATLPDEAFKRVAMSSLARIGRVVAVFDNEPANCNVARQHHPDALVGRVETQQVPGSPELVAGVTSIRDFRRA